MFPQRGFLRQGAFRFLDLPRELRNNIYEYYAEDTQFEVSYPIMETAKPEPYIYQTYMFGSYWKPRWRPALAITCSQIFAEYRQEVLAKTNGSMAHAFYIEAKNVDDLTPWPTVIADAASIPQATVIRLYMDMYSLFFHHRSKYLDEVLKGVAMFERLQHLELDVKVPLQSSKTLFMSNLLNSLKMLPVYMGKQTKALLDVTVSFEGEVGDKLVRAMADGELIWLYDTQGYIAAWDIRSYKSFSFEAPQGESDRYVEAVKQKRKAELLKLYPKFGV